ncbi:unnamed protein product [Darwinula stevensoni]|uniref:Mab-21-like HhH/H2TH-like domain-containing protein n=1 Tax=Darwinula stevensoni TaxID=69355 RepID=A0A7R9ADG8_9CRUS|nr:unnamed protein product [Darwinula stevensoni]CAG0901302.1 unnamed protein product [Darwinula stevensoni]
MGNACCSGTSDQTDEAGHPIPNDDSVDGGHPGSSDEADEAKELSFQALQYDLLHRQHMFILNNVFLAVQFFGNYEKEKEEIDAMKNERDREMTRKLLPRQKTCFFTGCLYEKLGDNVMLRRRKEPHAKSIAPAMEYYINYENAEILSDESRADRDRAGLQFKMDTDTKAFQRGEVYLCLDRGADEGPGLDGWGASSIGYESSDYASSTDASCCDSGNRIHGSSDRQEYKEANALFPASAKAAWTSKMQNEKIGSHLTADRRPDVSDPGIRNPRVSDFSNGRMIRSELHDCIRHLRRHLRDDSRTSSTLNVDVLSSSALARRFTENFEDVALLLGDEELAYDYASRYHTVSYETRSHGNSSHYAFVPTIAVPFWPDEWREWIAKKRAPARDPRIDLVHSWPTKEIVEKALRLGCNLIPRLPDRPSRPSATHSWTADFGKIETFLLATLRHSQIRCYLFCILLYKTFLEDARGPLVNALHIRHILLKACEDDPLRWPAERSAEKVFHVFRSLLQALQKQRLQNYFVRKTNILENVPMNQILRISKRLSEILESWPVGIFHVLEALGSLEFAPGFYPRFPFEKLNYYLTVDKETLIAQLPITENPEHPETINSAGEESEENARIRRERARHYMRNQRIFHGRGIDFNAKIWHLEKIRLNSILPLFIEHFIAMGRKSDEFRDRSQALLYLNQAENLTRLVRDQCHDGEKSNRYFEDIKRVRSTLRVGVGDRRKETPWTSSSSKSKSDKVLLRSRQFQKSSPKPTTPSRPANPQPADQAEENLVEVQAGIHAQNASTPHAPRPPAPPDSLYTSAPSMGIIREDESENSQDETGNPPGQHDAALGRNRELRRENSFEECVTKL